MNFLRAEPGFLAIVDSVIVEWHKWRVTFDEVREHLEQHEFRHASTIEQSDQMGTAVFRR